MNKYARGLLSLGLVSALVFLAGCTASRQRKIADRTAYAVIREKTTLVRNMDPNFTIERTNTLVLDELPISTNVYDFLGTEGESERGARVLGLTDALAIAVEHSRAYQSQKEQLFLEALSATFTRHQFTPIFSAAANGRFSGRTEQVETFVFNPDTGELEPVLSDNLVEQQSVTVDGEINASWLIRDVGRLTTAFSFDFLRFVTGDPRVSTSSQLAAQFTRPLWRDAGFKQQMEALTQAERDLLYEVREFTQYRRDFSVQIATAFYGVLGQRDIVRNNYLNLQSSRKNAERTRALAEEGRVTQSDLGRIAQQELTSESAWINASRNYRQSLDDFKLLLGLSVDQNLVLDDSELQALKIQHPKITPEDSIKVALAARLDYLNTKEQLEESDRKVVVAANGLKPTLNLNSSVVVNSDPKKDDKFLPLPDFDRYSYSAGLFFDPALDRTAERNAYRTALISRDRTARLVEQQEDEIKLEVRDGWRTLDAAKRNYEISEIGVELSERRVEEQNLLAEFGRAKAQDQVDAQNDLVNSKNQRTQALVAHTIARLQFWNNLGILYIKNRGQWEEINDATIQ